MGSAVDGECKVSFLPILNRSMRKSKQYEQTDACSPVNNLTFAQQELPIRIQATMTLTRKTVMCAPAVYQPPASCLPNESILLIRQTKYSQQDDLITYRPKPRSELRIGNLVTRQALMSKFSAKYTVPDSLALRRRKCSA